ncbi:hypothetical protein NDU88_013014 [Pleurodeles waltl]|uniref:Uncharacterized protein n=1 Tax=Pleurodeles waltl TaxID=8319 RepID=A0AAV7R3I2_PLEWA|nr:hypothetical protein NDU88_013014 [Pleurodeles waltl]
MESTPMRNGAEEGGVLRSRDQKDFFEEKQLVILRAQHQAADCAKHVNLQRLMPRTDVHWGTEPKSHKQVGDGQMPKKCQLLVQRSFYWTEEARNSAGTTRARDFPFGGWIPHAVESRAEVFSRRLDANKPC